MTPCSLIDKRDGEAMSDWERKPQNNATKVRTTVDEHVLHSAGHDATSSRTHGRNNVRWSICAPTMPKTDVTAANMEVDEACLYPLNAYFAVLLQLQYGEHSQRISRRSVSIVDVVTQRMYA